MKNRYIQRFFLLLLIAFMGTLAMAQQGWPRSEAIWIYCLFDWKGDAYAKETWAVTGDSLIRAQHYRIMQPVDSLGAAVPHSGKMLLVRFENDTVYRFVNNEEYLFFAFHLNVGDTYTTFRSFGWSNYGNDSTCTSKKPIKITGKKEVIIDGQVLNEYFATDMLSDQIHQGYRFVDRIGFTDSYPLIDICEDENCFHLSDCTTAQLSEYHDNDIDYVLFVCEPTSMQELTQKDFPFEIYPNPVKEVLNFVTKTQDILCEYKLSFFTILGTLVWETVVRKENSIINLSTIPAGYYVLRITPINESKQSFYFPIIKSEQL